MSDTKLQQTTDSDALDRMITERLEERQKKLDRMAEMEHGLRQSNAHIWSICISVAIAACIAALFIWSPFSTSNVSPWDDLGLEQPALSEYRAASSEISEINTLIESGDNIAALTKVKAALERSDMEVFNLADIVDVWPDDNTMEYEEKLERMHNSELRWTYIYLLVMTGKNKEAKKQLKRYLKATEFCEHEEEARNLLEKL